MGDASAIIGQVLQGTYRVERLVGEGGMGAVFEASHLRLRRRFAIKVLTPEVASNAEAFARFRREAEITSELGHPNIIEVIDFNTAPDGAPYIVMELLEGESLDCRVAKARHLSLEVAAAILRQTASALQAAHRRGIIHRDLKPQNIFLCARETQTDFVKVLDFGISKVLGSSSLLTSTRAIMGTPSYMSPEQAEGRGSEADARTDVFSLGTILYEMFSGRPPFLADTIPATLYQVVHAEPPPLQTFRPDLPEAVVEVVARAMRKRPDDRYGSIDELAQDFERVLQASTRPGPEPAPGAVALAKTTAAPQAILPSYGQSQAASRAVDQSSPATPAHPTTLSASAGELRDVMNGPPRKAAPYWGAGLAALAVIGGGIYFALRPASEGPARRPSAAPTATTQKQAVRPLLPEGRADARASAAVKPGPAPLRSPDAKAAPPREPLSPLEPVATPRTRLLSVTSNPDGAEVFVNGRRMGTTPLHEEVSRAGAKITLKKPGFRVWAGRVPTGSRPATLAAKLTPDQPPPPPTIQMGTLRVLVKIKGRQHGWGDVYLDGTRVFQAPAPAQSVATGQHEVEVRQDCCFPVKRTVTIEPGKTAEVRIELTPR